MWMVSSLLCVAAWVARVAGTGDSPTTVNGTRGQSVSLHPGIPVGLDVVELVWRRLSPRMKIVTYSNKISDYYGSEEYKRRITLHPGNFSLEIRDLQREDTGDYEVTVTASSGAQTQNKMRLDVYAGTGDSLNTVNGTQGQSMSLHPGIPVGPDVVELVWRRLSPRVKIVTYSNKISDYYGSEEYKRRITLHPRNFSLEIRDLQREDTGDYEVTVTASSGAQTQNKMQLDVYEWMGTVKGARGQLVYLPAGITAGLDISQVVWRSKGTTIVEYANGHISFFGPEEYKRRITFHPGNFSLEIRDLRREDTGDYEVTVTSSSGAQTQNRIRLEVCEWMGTVKGAQGWLVYLPAEITLLLNISQVVWRSKGTTIVEYANGNISFFGPEEYKRRMTFHPGNFSLEIRDLRREDADPGVRSSPTAWIIPVVVILILLLVCCCIYRKRAYLRSHWDKCMGKKSGTSDDPTVGVSLNSRPGGEHSS
ncbi:uncharacterized protein LOC134355363 isoform X2 [Mobula hypostoma]|uniref:uncharacterized protein LOC134355363 isoform X2 n=1 Tax=Mobula hypostoma TaxID=723540 RepID=UPI002FC3836B